MYKVNMYEIDSAAVTGPGARGVNIQWAISEKNGGAPVFAMRRFVIDEDGHTPFHAHDWEHEVYVLSGTGVVKLEGEEVPIKAGDAVLVPAGEMHGFNNTGIDAPLEFLCLVPNGPATEGH